MIQYDRTLLMWTAIVQLYEIVIKPNRQVCNNIDLAVR